MIPRKTPKERKKRGGIKKNDRMEEKAKKENEKCIDTAGLEKRKLADTQRVSCNAMTSYVEDLHYCLESMLPTLHLSSRLEQV